jgi:uncharacterized protein YlxW (UPF0749 family)
MLRSSIQDTSNEINKLLSEIKSLYETLNAKDSRIIDLENQLSALQTINVKSKNPITY